MAGRKQQGFDDQLELEQILLQAQHRWLRPAEVCEIIRNHTRLRLSDEPANMPQSGRLFLYDRKRVRSFRKDGHRWKKTRNGKAVKEAHERLKAGGVEALHCYYAHGEDNENFQRRSYSMLELDLSDIILVHYQELESIKTSFNHVKDLEEVVPYSNETEELAPTPEMQNSISSSSNPSNFQMHSQAIDAGSLNTAQASEFKNAKSAFNHQASLRLQPFLELQQPMAEKIDAEFSDAYCPTVYSKNQQIFLEARHRWLRPAEICEILQNYEKFHISSELANMPPGGTLFLYDRKVLRNFRKDGHNWRKKKDGKTVTEGNEKLKVGNVEVLHCYYAHGEENENFQRRVYSMLEDDLSHIVLVHYREVEGKTTNFNHIKETEEVVPYSREIEMNSVSTSFNPSIYQTCSQATNATSLSSARASEFEDAESAAFHNQARSRLQPMPEKINADFSEAYHLMPFPNGYQEKLSTIPGLGFSALTQAFKRLDSNDARVTYDLRKNHEFTSWNNVESSATSIQFLSFQPSFSATPSDPIGNFSKQENELRRHLFTDSLDKTLVYGMGNKPKQNWQTSEGSSNWPMDRSLHSLTEYNVTTLHDGVDTTDLLKSLGPFLMDLDKQNDLQFHLSNTDTIAKRNDNIEGKADHPSAIKPLLDGPFGDGLLNSFNLRMSKELEDVDEPQMQFSSGAYWDTLEIENEVDESSVPLQVCLDSYMLGPSLSHDQLFSIVDFSPTWAYENSEIKVLITGRFLKSQHAESCKWSCMFGEVEVPAEVIADGVLRCYTPIHKAGRVPFYVTSSDRMACSEVREFEYQVGQTQDVDSEDYYSDCINETLSMHFGKLLSISSTSPNCDPASIAETSELTSKITSLLKGDETEWDKMLQLTSDKDFPLERVEEHLVQQLFKEKFHAWLLQKLAAGGKVPSVLENGGPGVLHFGAALGYDWVLLPMITAGVSVNFRDENGWTALRWAAFFGRARTVDSLISLGAAPGE